MPALKLLDNAFHLGLLGVLGMCLEPSLESGDLALPTDYIHYYLFIDSDNRLVQTTLKMYVVVTFVHWCVSI